MSKLLEDNLVKAERGKPPPPKVRALLKATHNNKEEAHFWVSPTQASLGHVLGCLHVDGLPATSVWGTRKPHLMRGLRMKSACETG